MVRERSNYGHRRLLALSHALLSLLYVWLHTGLLRRLRFAGRPRCASYPYGW